MKYIKETKHKQDKDSIGIILGCIYLFFTYLGDSVFFPGILTKGALLAFLGYGAMTVVNRFASGSFVLSKYSIWYGLFLFYVVCTFPLSANPQLSMNSNHLREMCIVFILTLFFIEFINSEREFKWICWAYVLSSFLMILMLYKSGKLIGNYNERLGNEVSGNANIFATFMMYTIMYSMWLLIYQKYDGYVKAFICLSIMLNFYAIMLSAGRKFLVIPFVFMFILLVMKNVAAFARNIFKYTLLMAVIIIFLYNLIMRVPMLYNAIGVRMEGLFNSITGNGEVDYSTLERSAMRTAAFNGWLEKPIFGNGFDMFKYLRSPAVTGGKHFYSHCTFVELLHNGGIVNFLLYYSLFGLITWNAITQKDRDVKFRALAIASIASEFILDYGGVFYDVVTTHVFLMLAVRAMEFGTEKKKKTIKYESRYIRE